MTALIVEDEALAARNLQGVLEEIGTVKVLDTLDSIAETLEWFVHHPKPDILFLDIHLADGSAFEIFDRISITCPVIFTTAYDEYALKAFRVNSIDYLLKPIDGKAVRRSLDKLASFSSHPAHADDFGKLLSYFKKTSAFRTHFLVPARGDKLIPLQADEMACIFIDTGLVKARTFDERTFTLEDTLDDLSGMLDPDQFFRANRQFIVARAAIRDVDFWFNSRLSLNLKVTIPEKVLISKARVPDFRKWFAGRHSMPF